MPILPRSGSRRVVRQRKSCSSSSGRLLETGDVASLGVHAGHDVLDQAVFAGGVHGLKDQQDRPLVLRVKFFLSSCSTGALCCKSSLAFSLE